MSSEKESRARQQHIHELWNQLKERIQETDPGTEQRRELNRQVDADNDAAQTKWFEDLTSMHPL